MCAAAAAAPDADAVAAAILTTYEICETFARENGDSSEKMAILFQAISSTYILEKTPQVSQSSKPKEAMLILAFGFQPI